MSAKNPLFDLTGRTALITGSSQGIGLALACGLAQAGAAVVLNGRDATKLAAAADTVRATVSGARVTFAAFDVTNAAAIEREVARIEAEFAPINTRSSRLRIYAKLTIADLKKTHAKCHPPRERES